MSVEIRMPELASDMTEGDLVQWLVAEGDRVEAGDLIAEIDTDKSTVEFESPVSGVVSELCIAAPATGVKVGELLARIEPSESAQAAASAADPAHGPVSATATGSPAAAPGKAAPAPAHGNAAGRSGEARAPSGAPATALARRIAGQRGIELANLVGSGAGGRVTKADVERAASGHESAENASVEGPPEAPLSRMQWSANGPAAHPRASGSAIQIEVVCNAGPLEATHRKLGETPGGVAVSIGDLAVAAAARALRDWPAANRSWRGSDLVTREGVDLRVQISGETDHVTVLVRDADRFGLAQLSERIRDLSERSRREPASPADLEEAGFGVTLLDDTGVTRVVASVEPPLTAVLGIGSLERVPVVSEDRVVPGTRLVCTLTADPRAIDTALGSRLMASFRRYVEDPLAMLL